MITRKDYDNNTFELDVADPSSIAFNFTLELQGTSAIILYPALCTPAVVSGNDAVKVLLLCSEEFMQTWEFSQQKGNQQCERMQD